MPTQQTVLVVGGTGRTGRRALQHLLDRGVSVRAIVRSGGKLPPDVAGNSNLTVIEASLLSLRDEELQQHQRGCDAVISLSRSCPQPQRNLRAAARPCCESDDAPVPGVQALQPRAPVKYRTDVAAEAATQRSATRAHCAPHSADRAEPLDSGAV